MKIGILTFHHTTNYGATLQAYALSQTLKRQNHDVEVIDYRPQVAINHYRKKIFNAAKPIAGKVPVKKKIKYSLAGLLKYFRMHYFLKWNIKLSRARLYDRAQLEEFWAAKEYDVIVCGSDQVWCIDSMRGFDSTYFLDFSKDVQKARKISYAASCGTTQTWGSHDEKIGTLISEFDAISVRDANSRDLLSKTCERPPTMVLDPTFLIDFSEFFQSSSLTQKPYLLLYIEGGLNKSHRTFVKSVASSQNLEVISIGDPIGLGQSLMSVSPIDWINYFHGATYVITNFFHGTVFSIKFKRQFTSIYKLSKASKTPDLLRRLKLEDRLLDGVNENTLSKHLSPVDYSTVNQVLEKEIAQSKRFLKEALV
ncbi:MAG: polysaccharide pyruvyl transferase family protein [Leptolyngbya sp. SIO1E4]|nr:polysaccharide pyruvyl transferase family protein [Leptolyngbya sp. SIO1E4]